MNDFTSQKKIITKWLYERCELKWSFRGKSFPLTRIFINRCQVFTDGKYFPKDNLSENCEKSFYFVNDVLGIFWPYKPLKSSSKRFLHMLTSNTC